MRTLSVYVHVPFCRRRCPYCSFYHVRPGDEGAFIDALEAEAAQVVRPLLTGSPRPELQSLYFGGGTPTVLTAASWKRLFAAIVGDRCPAMWEVTCEVNPEDATEEMFRTLSRLGVNRISLGIQTMDAGAQVRLGRCPPAVNRRAIAAARRHFGNVSFDLLLGVPRREMPSLDETLDELIECAPEHFSVYCLEPGGDLGSVVKSFFDDVDPERSADEYLRACDRLRSAGYHHYEVSNFSRLGQESVHNRVYWDGGDYVGLGPAAHSYLGGRRFCNPPSLDRYLETASLPGGDRWIVDDAGEGEAQTERLMLSLRTDRGVPLESLSCPTATIDDILNGGLAEVSGGRLRLSPSGFLLLNEITLRLSRGAQDRLC